MTEELTPIIMLSEQQPARPVRTLEALLRLYAEGHRNFSGSDLRGMTVNMIDKEIKYLDLREIILKGSNLTAIILTRLTAPLKVDLTGSDLSNCNLQGANLSGCRLDQCNFSNSNLRGANLHGCSCRGSDFIQAKLQNTSGDFTASNFTKANFRSSSLTGNFSQANFRGSNFHKATLHYFESPQADFSDADLRDIVLSTGVNIKYSYYNHKTKFSKDFDPIRTGMELIENESDSNESDAEDGNAC